MIPIQPVSHVIEWFRVAIYSPINFSVFQFKCNIDTCMTSSVSQSSSMLMLIHVSNNFEQKTTLNFIYSI